MDVLIPITIVVVIWLVLMIPVFIGFHKNMKK